MIRQEAGIATMCVGTITSADQVNTILAAGRADLVALARPHLTDPSFTLRAAAHTVRDVACPPQYQWGKDAPLRNAAREQADLCEMKPRPAAKPRAGAPAARCGVGLVSRRRRGRARADRGRTRAWERDAAFQTTAYGGAAFIDERNPL